MIFIHNRQACGEAERKGENPEDVKRPLNKLSGLLDEGATAARRFPNND